MKNSELFKYCTIEGLRVKDEVLDAYPQIYSKRDTIKSNVAVLLQDVVAKAYPEYKSIISNALRFSNFTGKTIMPLHNKVHAAKIKSIINEKYILPDEIEIIVLGYSYGVIGVKELINLTYNSRSMFIPPLYYFKSNTQPASYWMSRDIFKYKNVYLDIIKGFICIYRLKKKQGFVFKETKELKEAKLRYKNLTT